MGIFTSKFEDRYREELKSIDEELKSIDDKFKCQREEREVERLRTDEELRKANLLIQETKCELGKMQERIEDAKNTKEEPQQMTRQTKDTKKDLQQMKQETTDTKEELQQMKQHITEIKEELQQMKQRGEENEGIWASFFIAITLGEFVWSLLKQPRIKPWSKFYFYDNFRTQFNNAARVLELGSLQLSRKFGKLAFYRNSKAHVRDWAEMDNRLLQCQKLFAIYPTL